ncbi:MAG: hypothetical protein J6T88_09275 [Bacteroidales bacterium]|nr:hypothetical protein [Bacteroidales bacterium]
MKSIIKSLCLCILTTFASLFGLQLSKYCNKDTLISNNAKKNGYIKAVILYAGFDTDTPFSVSPEKFDMWYGDTSIVSVTINNPRQIAFIDSIINCGEPVNSGVIDTRCRITITKNENKLCFTDSFYLSPTLIFHKNNGVLLKNNENTQKAIQSIIFNN